jgi:hypothetical protein
MTPDMRIYVHTNMPPRFPGWSSRRLGEQTHSRSESTAQDPLAYISYYINGYARP